MVAILWLGVGLGILYFWLTGHWFGWVLAFFPLFWLVQISLHQGPAADAPSTIFLRAVIVFICTGIPCALWGSASRWREIQ